MWFKGKRELPEDPARLLSSEAVFRAGRERAAILLLYLGLSWLPTSLEGYKAGLGASSAQERFWSSEGKRDHGEAKEKEVFMPRPASAHFLVGICWPGHLLRTRHCVERQARERLVERWTNEPSQNKVILHSVGKVNPPAIRIHLRKAPKRRCDPWGKYESWVQVVGHKRKRWHVFWSFQAQLMHTRNEKIVWTWTLTGKKQGLTCDIACLHASQEGDWAGADTRKVKLFAGCFSQLDSFSIIEQISCAWIQQRTGQTWLLPLWNSVITGKCLKCCHGGRAGCLWANSKRMWPCLEPEGRLAQEAGTG